MAITAMTLTTNQPDIYSLIYSFVSLFLDYVLYIRSVWVVFLCSDLCVCLSIVVSSDLDLCLLSPVFLFVGSIVLLMGKAQMTLYTYTIMGQLCQWGEDVVQICGFNWVWYLAVLGSRKVENKYSIQPSSSPTIVPSLLH